MADLGSVGWDDRARAPRRWGGLFHDHPIVVLLVAATLLVGVLVVVTAGALHGHDLAQFVGVGFVGAATTLWFAAAVLLGPADPTVPELDRPRHRHAG